MKKPTIETMSDTLFQMQEDASNQFRPKPRSKKQCAIVAALQSEPHITLAAAVELIGGDIYANANAHVGALLANMAKKGMIKRLKPGVFTL